jgi:pimeloyl-ACP methyl ester carboxylesterase
MKPVIFVPAHYYTIAALVILSLVSCNVAYSQVNKLDEKNLEETMRNPWSPNRSVFLQDWLILGSIPIRSMEEIDTDFFAADGGEAAIQATEGQTATVNGVELKWVPMKSKDIVDLQEFFRGGKTEDVVAYAYATIHRKEAGKVYLSMGTDDAVKVWVNGVMVHRLLQLRALTMDEDGIPVTFNQGANRLLLKIQQGKGGWGFVVRMLDNPNQLSVSTGNIDFTLKDGAPAKKTVTIHSNGNLDQTLLSQTAEVEAYGAGGKIIAKKSFTCGEPVSLDYSKWKDGCYEFRFIYEDVRGNQNVKYASWFKGDILARMRNIVQSAPDKSVRTPEAVTHRMLADMILDRVAGNLKSPDSAQFNALHSPLMEFEEIQTNEQVRPGGFVRLAYIDDIDNTPQFCRSYLPLTYDPKKKTPLVVYLHGYNGANPEYFNWWSADKRHDPVSDKHGVIFIEPHGRGNTQYLGIGDRDVLKCIEMAKQRFNVDEDRVYLVGASMGGFGTWNVATRHPGLFAAIAPIYGGGDYHVYTPKENLEQLSSWETFLLDKSSSSAQLESLLNMPILVTHGDQDQSVNVDLSRYLVRMLQRWDYDVRYIEVPGKGHTELGLWDQTIEWMLNHKRNAFPRHVRVRSADLQTASAYWVKVIQEQNPGEFMIVDAEALEGNLIRVDSKNVSIISIMPSRSLVDEGKPVRVVWNGNIFVENNPRAAIVLRETDYKQSPFCKTPTIAGPIADFQNTPFLIVVGTGSKDSLMNKVIQQHLATIVGDWKGAQKFEPRVKNDTEVTEEEMKLYSLFLLGGPSENAVANLLAERIPFSVSSGEIRIDGASFRAKDAVLHAIYPNPFNKERYVALVAPTSGAGLSFFDPHRGSLLQYDYYITDGKVPVFSAGAKDEKILVVSGFFNNDWKVDKAYLNKGEDSLRSKCAYAVVNPDLSTSIVSAAQPTAELLKAYVGMYQVQNGPLVKVFLDNNGFKAAQMPNEQFALTLVPTSDNEFYIKEFNIALGFERDSATNDYIMVVYQNGQKFVSKKVK